MGSFVGQHSVLTIFASHKVAANLLMILMILGGIWGLMKLNTQFFPNFELDYVTVQVPWTGASAEDIEASITAPVELQLRSTDGLREMTSTSSQGLSYVVLEFEQGTDMNVALGKVKERVDLIRNLPAEANEPEITKIVHYEPVARLLVTTKNHSKDLRILIRQIERELLDAGIAKISIIGLPDEEIAIQVSSHHLRELGLTLDDIANRIAASSQDIPAGTVGKDDIARSLRALQQQKRVMGFAEIPVSSNNHGRLVKLGDIANIEKRARNGQVKLEFKGLPAVELLLQRAEGKDTLESAQILQDWIALNHHQLPKGVQLHVYDENWTLIKQRIQLLLKNGLGGLVLVVGVLFVFMSGRAAFWVAVGIPVSFMATLAILYLVGGSINMISLFAMIMTLGIIVDDAIVVGENSLAQFESGKQPLAAAESGARRMFPPVISSSLTTIAAFFPLMLVSGIIGNILFDIPLVVICVILASLIESFLVLPGHLRASFESMSRRKSSRARQFLDKGFNQFRQNCFRPIVTWSVRNPGTILASAIACLVLTVGLFVGGRLAFNFFPSPDGTVIHANVGFVAGTPQAKVEQFLTNVEQELYKIEKNLDTKLIATSVVRIGTAVSSDEQSNLLGDQYGSITVELVEPDMRTMRNIEFISSWKESITLPPGIESFSIFERKPGPPGRDVEIELSGTQVIQLKSAALSLGDSLGNLTGVIAVQDDLPYGPEQLIYNLNPLGKTLGFTVDSVGSQLRAAYDGTVAQIFQDSGDEIEVRVLLPDVERRRISSLEQFTVVTPNGALVPLSSVVDLTTRRGFQSLKKTNGRVSVRISTDVDPAIATANEIRKQLEKEILPTLVETYGVDYRFEGRNADQDDTMEDMLRGGLLALAIIYLVLSWVFSSYGWPLVVMSAIPFGIVGALTGHWILGLDVTILSLFGLFGLSGIVVNDSIILVTCYNQLRQTGRNTVDAIIDAACMRLRAVLLTSLTTIGGLTPLLFETSLQAQFLIPMAASICFGLAFATFLVLLFVPSLLIVHERLFGKITDNVITSSVTAKNT